MKKPLTPDEWWYQLKQLIIRHSKKIVVGMAVVIFFGIGMLWALIGAKDGPKNPDVPAASPTLFDINRIPTVPDAWYPTYPPTPIPKEGDLIISGIAVHNFIPDAKIVLPNGDALIKETGQYQIVYTASLEAFLISITDADFPRAWAAAERDFLAILGIDEPNACRLTVEVTTPAAYGNDYSGQVLPLSFCGDVD